MQSEPGNHGWKEICVKREKKGQGENRDEVKQTGKTNTTYTHIIENIEKELKGGRESER